MIKLQRENAHTVIATPLEGVQSRIYANDQIKLEPVAIEELEFFSTIDGLSHLSFTPDFHKGAGTPIGTSALINRIYPKVVGSDIGCGMRFDVTSINSPIEVTPKIIETVRHAFFGGGRDVHVQSRFDLLAYGLETSITGNTMANSPKRHNAHDGGALGDGQVSHVLKTYTDFNGTRENFLGSIGGGNHFVELQVVDEIIDRKKAFELGLKVGSYCIMSHSGSLDLGHLVFNYFTDLAQSKHVGVYPKNNFFKLDGDDAVDYSRASYNVANFATANRAVLSAMLAGALETSITSIYDSPHNLVWNTGDGYLHRKGSCPAGNEEIVMIPGSMGTRSVIALGHGFAGTLGSSAHGAGRILNRNAARKETSQFDPIVISKVDLKTVRSDIANDLSKALAEEAPTAYKDIEQVVASQTSAGITSPIAWMKPVFTIKG